MRAEEDFEPWNVLHNGDTEQLILVPVLYFSEGIVELPSILDWKTDSSDFANLMQNAQ